MPPIPADAVTIFVPGSDTSKPPKKPLPPPEEPKPLAEPDVEQPLEIEETPEQKAAGDRYGRALRALKVAEEAVVASPDAPKALKLEVLQKHRAEAERRQTNAINYRDTNQRIAANSILLWQNLVAQATDPKALASWQRLLDLEIKHKDDSLKRDEVQVTETTAELQRIDALIAANS